MHQTGRKPPITRYLIQGNEISRGQSEVEDHAIHLLFSANRWEAAAQIKRDIASGTTLIIDRYHYSGCVYTAAKNIPGLGLEWAFWPEVGLPCPDICIFLKISPAVAQARGGYGEEKYEKGEMQNRVRLLFESMYREEPDRFRVIDAGRQMEDVEREVLDVILEEMRRLKNASEDAARLQAVQPMRGPAALNQYVEITHGEHAHQAGDSKK
ncbi:MAG: Thymidylate kinase [Peltula sp. TS41687]|nr:MAG: Thymidylate kinase [Peltula sp. TS41687]